MPVVSEVDRRNVVQRRGSGICRKWKIVMIRITQLFFMLIAFSSLSLSAMSASVSADSYPASMCRQIYGPEDGLNISAAGKISNNSADGDITVLCPVVVDKTQKNTTLEVAVNVLDVHDSGTDIRCQLGQSGVSNIVMSSWGNRVRSKVSDDIQVMITRISAANAMNASLSRSMLSCTLPAQVDNHSPSLISYLVR